MQFKKIVSLDTIIQSLVTIVLIVSVFYTGCQYRLYRKNIQSKYKQGEIRLLHIVGNYVINTRNMYTEEGKFKKDDSVNTKQYIEEAKIILHDLHDLLKNPYYIDLLEKYPDINLAYMALRRNIIEQEIEIRNSDFALSGENFKRFHKIYNLLKEEIDNKEILRSEYFQGIDEAYKFLDKELSKQIKK